MQIPPVPLQVENTASDFDSFFVIRRPGYGLWASYSDSLSLNFFDYKMSTKSEPTTDEHCEDLIIP